MKIKYLFMSALACGLLGACSNDEVVENNADNFNGGEAYVKVRIAMSNGAGTRAGSGGYVNGSKEEQTIQNIQFAFYDNNGNWVADGVRQRATDVTSGTDGDNVEGIAEAVLALELEQGEDRPTQVIAYVNVPTGFSTSGYSIEQMKDQIAAGDVAVANNFVMTNSTYYSGREVIATQVPDEAFKTSEADALAGENTVDIYVERLAAKVKIQQGENLKENMPDLNSGRYTLNFVLEGLALNATNNKEYYLKNLNASWNADTPWKGWNNADEYRCFWAEDPNYEAAPATGDISFVSWEDAKFASGATSFTGYCKENTLTAARFTAGSFEECTHALVVGHYELIDTEGEDTPLVGSDSEPITFYMYRNTAYLEEDLMNIIANNAFVYVQTNADPATYEVADASAYKLVAAASVTDVAGADNNQMTAALNWETGSATTYYTTTDGSTFTAVTAETLAALNTQIATQVGEAEVYTRGAAYFAVPIEHLNSTKGADGQYGVVRNHSYVLTIQSIEGMGEGVFNPGQIIVPQPPKDKYYVGATLNILSWHVVEQDVNL